MSATWSQSLPVTSIVLPTGGARVPGSGTVVLNANPQDGTLPPELVALGYTEGTIAYSTDASAYDYYWQCIGPSNMFDVGYTFHGVVSVVSQTQIQGQLFLNGPGASYTGVIIGPNEYRSTSYDGVSAKVVRLLNSNTPGKHPYLEETSNYTDNWSANTLLFSGTLNGGSCTLRIVYYLTFDRILHLQYLVQFTTAPTAGNLVFPPGTIPVALRPLVNPLSLNTIGNGTGATNHTAIVHTNGQFDLVAINTTVSTYSGTVNYPIAKT